MKNQPQLLKVPNFYNMLTVKADLNGITVLKDGRFKKRYTGSKQYAVDINGILRTSGELSLLTSSDRLRPTKKVKGPAKAPEPIPTNGAKVEKSYKINKPEIRARIFTMIAAQPAGKKELYFWTVTFPARTPDETTYRLFNTWLTKLRQKNYLRQYVWIAERQTGERKADRSGSPTNTIHFHLAIPHKMPVKQANREMMICICNAIKAGEIPYTIAQAKRYNGVDIAKDRKGTRKVINFALGKRGRRSLTGYLTKYVTKNEGSFPHLAWHNSRGFSALFTAVTFTFEESRHVYGWRFFAHSRPAIDNNYFFYFPWINGPPSNLEGELVKLNSFIQSLN